MESQPRRRRRARLARPLLAIVLLGVTGLLALQAREPIAGFVVSGNSMEPGIHRGDVVIVRAQHRGYTIGDAVAYRHRDLGPVLHRIVGESAEGFVLQGDNRDTPDAYPVAAAEVLGKLVFYVPGAGRAVDVARANAFVPASAVAALLLGGVTGWRRRRGTERPAGNLRGRQPGPWLRGEYFAITSRGERIAAALTVLVLVALGTLGVVAVLGTMQPTTTREAYEHYGQFRYSAPGAPGVYDTSDANTGDPVFRRIADRVDVAFEYELRSSVHSDAVGTYRMDVRLSQANGWTRTLPLVPERPFRGTRADVAGALDLRAVQDAIDAVEQQTGVGSRAYLLTLLPRIELDGTLRGEPLQDTFAPEQRFLMDAQMLQPQPPPGRNDLAFDRSQRNSVTVTVARTRAFSLAGVELQFTTLRAAAIGVLAIAVPALAGWIIAAFFARRGDEATAIEAQYGDLLVHAHLNQLPATQALVIVDSMDELIRIAERSNLPVVDEHDEEGIDPPEFFVIAPNGATYLYRPHTVQPRQRRMGA